MGMCIKRLVKIPHIKFHENISVEIALSREVRRTDGWTDFTRLIIVFRNCNAVAPTNEFVGIVSGSSTKSSEKKIRNGIGRLSPAPLL